MFTAAGGIPGARLPLLEAPYHENNTPSALSLSISGSKVRPQEPGGRKAAVIGHFKNRPWVPP